MPTVEYRLCPQGPVLNEYAICRERNSFIMGPLGGGKTVQTILKIFDLMIEQQPVTAPGHKNEGIRLSRWIAARNTYSELFSTTIKDWLEIHGDLGVFKQGSKEPPTHKLEFALEDGTKVFSEIIFIAFDRPDHVKKARGIQATGIWLNELKEIPKSVIDMLDLRHGRYPSKKEGVSPTWHGMLGDTNAPDQDHFYYELAEIEKPEGWAFHRQPPAVIKVGDAWEENPNAENLKNLPKGYYKNGLRGKSDDWIKVNLANEYGFVSDGKPVHPFYQDYIHCIPEYNPTRDKKIVLGFDFGRTPACAFLQETSFGGWICFDEFLAEDVGAVEFAPSLHRYIEREYPDYSFRGWGDPAGGHGNQTTDQTPFMVLRAAGIPAMPTNSNDPIKRRAAVEVPLKSLGMDGKPRLLISAKAKMIRKGLQGGFCYRRVQVSGERYTDEPDKNVYSHPVEALEYALQGEGEGREALIKTNKSARQPAKVNFSVWG